MPKILKIAHSLKAKWRSDDIRLHEDADFSSLLLSDRVLKGLKKTGYEIPSPIQLKAIPPGNFGKDLLVQAKSGTGKTLVFTIVALEALIDVKHPQAMIIAPTREIAIQIRDVIRAVGYAFKDLVCNCFIGGMPLEDDAERIIGCQIIVGTPGRLKHLINIGVISTNSIRLFVLDEADVLLEDSFKNELEFIFQRLPTDKQVIATSATYPKELDYFVNHYFRNVYMARLNDTDFSLLGMVHYIDPIQVFKLPLLSYQTKLKALEKVLVTVQFTQCVVFCNLVTRVEPICNEIRKLGFTTAFISSAKEQKDRIKTMECLRHFRCKVLVSSDLSSRGIDVETVNLIINFDYPTHAETYFHRCGRAGRYGTKGVAITFLTDDEKRKFEDMKEKQKFKVYLLPDPVPNNLISLRPQESDVVEADLSTNDSNNVDELCKISNAQTKGNISNKEEETTTPLLECSNVEESKLDEPAEAMKICNEENNTVLQNESKNEDELDSDTAVSICDNMKPSKHLNEISVSEDKSLLSENILISNVENESCTDVVAGDKTTVRIDFDINDENGKFSNDIEMAKNDSQNLTGTLENNRSDVEITLTGSMKDSDTEKTDAALKQNENSNKLSLKDASCNAESESDSCQIICDNTNFGKENRNETALLETKDICSESIESENGEEVEISEQTNTSTNEEIFIHPLLNQICLSAGKFVIEHEKNMNGCTSEFDADRLESDTNYQPKELLRVSDKYKAIRTSLNNFHCTIYKSFLTELGEKTLSAVRNEGKPIVDDEGNVSGNTSVVEKNSTDSEFVRQTGKNKESSHSSDSLSSENDSSTSSDSENDVSNLSEVGAVTKCKVKRYIIYKKNSENDDSDICENLSDNNENGSGDTNEGDSMRNDYNSAKENYDSNTSENDDSNTSESDDEISNESDVNDISSENDMSSESDASDISSENDMSSESDDSDASDISSENDMSSESEDSDIMVSENNDSNVYKAKSKSQYKKIIPENSSYHLRQTVPNGCPKPFSSYGKFMHASTPKTKRSKTFSGQRLSSHNSLPCPRPDLMPLSSLCTSGISCPFANARIADTICAKHRQNMCCPHLNHSYCQFCMEDWNKMFVQQWRFIQNFSYPNYYYH